MSERSERERALAGAELETLDSAKCERALAWLLGEESQPPKLPGGLKWALAHCDDGVTWGRWDAAEGRWRLASDVKSEVSPRPARERLQQLRLFGPEAEVFIWRDGEELLGRVLKDADAMPAEDPLRPSDENRILLGDYVLESLPNGFTHVGDRAGLHQVLPLAVDNPQLNDRQARLKVRHYWAQDPETGAVRIVATRLVDVCIGD